MEYTCAYGSYKINLIFNGVFTTHYPHYACVAHDFTSRSSITPSAVSHDFHRCVLCRLVFIIRSGDDALKGFIKVLSEEHLFVRSWRYGMMTEYNVLKQSVLFMIWFRGWRRAVCWAPREWLLAQMIRELFYSINEYLFICYKNQFVVAIVSMALSILLFGLYGIVLWLIHYMLILCGILFGFISIYSVLF